jgi:flagellar protein FliO/FliZ
MNEPISVIPVAASLIAVVVTILALGWVLRRMPGAGRSANGAMRIRSALAVGTRERVLWIEAGGKHLLIGVTAQNVSKLHEFTEVPAEAPPAPSSEFAKHLRRALGQKPD